MHLVIYFDIYVGYLVEVIRDNNFTRKRTKTRHYSETRYNKPINFVKELDAFYKRVGEVVCDSGAFAFRPEVVLK